MHLLLSSPVHVLICGRQGNDFAEDGESGEMKNLGYKMRAEGETAYEPDVLVRLEAHKASKKALAIPVAHIEKDRTGVLAGQSIPSPTFDSLARPLLGLLGTTQAAMQSEEEVGVQDAEALARQEWERTRRSAEAATEYTGRFALAESVAELHRIGGELQPAIKARLTAKDLERVRRAYATRLAALQAPAAAPAAEPERNGS